MADEPENIDLQFLAEQGKRILDELAEARVERKAMREDFAGMRSDISDLQHEVAAMRVDQRRTNELLEQVHEVQKNQGARLNVIEGRLALIEKHTGMVQA